MYVLVDNAPLAFFLLGRLGGLKEFQTPGAPLPLQMQLSRCATVQQSTVRQSTVCGATGHEKTPVTQDLG